MVATGSSEGAERQQELNIIIRIAGNKTKENTWCVLGVSS